MKQSRICHSLCFFLSLTSAQVSTRCRLSVAGDSHEPVAPQHQSRFPMFFQGVMTPSLMPAGPDAWHMLDQASMSVVIVIVHRDSSCDSHGPKRHDHLSCSDPTSHLCGTLQVMDMLEFWRGHVYHLGRCSLPRGITSCGLSGTCCYPTVNMEGGDHDSTPSSCLTTKLCHMWKLSVWEEASVALFTQSRATRSAVDCCRCLRSTVSAELYRQVLSIWSGPQLWSLRS